MIFTCHSGEEQGWRCAYRNLKDEDQEEPGAPEGVVRGKSKEPYTKAMVWFKSSGIYHV